MICQKYIDLPYPKIRKDVLSVEQAIAYRRSIRDFKEGCISIEQLSQLLWVSYGITYPSKGFKSVPSAGATYPLTIYVVVGRECVCIDKDVLCAGSYRYDPYRHAIELVKSEDLRSQLATACLDQPWVEKAQLSFVISAVYEITTRYYHDRGIRYVHFEAGHVAQNIYLEATALGLGAVAIGAFYDSMVKDVVGLREEETPLYIVSVGIPKHVFVVDEKELSSFIKAHRT